MSSSLTPEEKNARMSEERTFLTKLLESALMGDWEKLEASVESYVRDHGTTPLEVLTQFRDGQKRTVLHFACQSQKSDDVDIVERVLNEKWIPNTTAKQLILKQKDKAGLTPIMLAAQQEREIAEKRVIYILKFAGDDLKLGLARSHAGATPLHYAAGAGGTAATIEALCNAGKVALNTFSKQGGTPLHWASAQTFDCTETIDALIRCGADPNAKPPDAASAAAIPSPLVMAVAASNDKHAKCLLQNENISIDTNLPGGVTLFHMAADLNLVGTLATLIERKQLQDAENEQSQGDGPVQVQSLKQVLEQKNNEGLTPINLAAREGHVGCVLLLLPRKEDDPPPTEDDARAYIENFKSTSSGSSNGENNAEKLSLPTQTGVSEKAAPSATEDDALQHATQVAAAPDATDDDQKIALECKAQGNKHFVAKEWKDAIEWYTKAIDANPKEAALYSNASACYNMLEEYDKSLWNAVVARTLRPEWSKGCYRMAVARLALGRFEDAALSAWEGLQQDQENDELKRLLQKCVKQGRKEHFQKKEEQSR